MRHVQLLVQVLKLTQAQSDTIVEMRKVLLHKLGTVYDERRQLHLQVSRLLEGLECFIELGISKFLHPIRVGSTRLTSPCAGLSFGFGCFLNPSDQGLAHAEPLVHGFFSQASVDVLPMNAVPLSVYSVDQTSSLKFSTEVLLRLHVMFLHSASFSAQDAALQ